MVGETQLVEAKGKPLVEPKGKHHRKNPLLPGLSLEKHQAIPSLDDVSILSLLHCQFLKFYSNCAPLPLQPIMKKFIALGAKCIEFWTAADKAKSKQPDILITRVFHDHRILV
jgi:hypothetical protein